MYFLNNPPKIVYVSADYLYHKHNNPELTFCMWTLKNDYVIKDPQHNGQVTLNFDILVLEESTDTTVNDAVANVLKEFHLNWYWKQYWNENGDSIIKKAEEHQIMQFTEDVKRQINEAWKTYRKECHDITIEFRESYNGNYKKLKDAGYSYVKSTFSKKVQNLYDTCIERKIPDKYVNKIFDPYIEMRFITDILEPERSEYFRERIENGDY